MEERNKDKLWLRTCVNNTLENMLLTIYMAMDIQRGDISPMQGLKYEDLVDEITTLFATLIE